MADVIDVLIQECQDRSIGFALVNGRLCYNDPKKQMTPAIMNLVKVRKLDVAKRLGYVILEPPPCACSGLKLGPPCKDLNEHFTKWQGGKYDPNRQPARAN